MNKEVIKLLEDNQVIIQRAENMCLASDGPVGKTIEEMTDNDIKEIYKNNDQALALLRKRPEPKQLLIVRPRAIGKTSEMIKRLRPEIHIEESTCQKEIKDLKAENERLKRPTDFPKVICLCGSTRFTDQMLIKQWELTKNRAIVLSWCALPYNYFAGEDKHHIGDQEGVKEIVDEVHKRKIDLADEVFVLNVGGYIGESTRSEIDYAIEKGKFVNYLEQSLTERSLSDESEGKDG